MKYRECYKNLQVVSNIPRANAKSIKIFNSHGRLKKKNYLFHLFCKLIFYFFLYSEGRGKRIKKPSFKTRKSIGSVTKSSSKNIGSRYIYVIKHLLTYKLVIYKFNSLNFYIFVGLQK